MPQRPTVEEEFEESIDKDNDHLEEEMLYGNDVATRGQQRCDTASA